MPPTYHRLTTRYARLTEATIDHCVEVVRDATEVISGHPVFDAADFVVSAAEILEAERLFEREGADFDEGDLSEHSDWTVACIADALLQASELMRARGEQHHADRLRERAHAALRRVAESGWCSPTIAYELVFHDLVDELRKKREPAGLSYLARAIVYDLERSNADQTLGRLRALARYHDILGNRDRAVDMFAKLLRYDPGDVRTYGDIAFVFARDLPEIASAAATRGLELIGSVDERGLASGLGRTLAELEGKKDGLRPQNVGSLLDAMGLDPSARERRTLRALCKTVEPDIATIPKKVRPPLPNADALRALREGLRTLPRPMPTPRVPSPAQKSAMPRSAVAAVSRLAKPGRNDPCPCGSGAKYKRCCLR